MKSGGSLLKSEKGMFFISGKRRALIWLTGAAVSFLTCFVLESRLFLTVSVWGEPSPSGLMTRGILFTLIYGMAFEQKQTKRRIVFCTVPGFLMAVMILLGLRYSLNTHIAESWSGIFPALLILTLLFSCMMCLLLLLPSIVRKKDAGNHFFRSWLIWMAFSWCVYLPVFLAVYPGIYSYDASVQLLQLFGEMPLSTHHPLLHTFYLGVCMKAGEYLFGSYQAGMAIHSLSQSLFMTSVFSFILTRMKQRGTPTWLLGLSWLFLVTNPYLTIFSFVTTKDVLFGGFFLLTFELACDFAAAPGKFLKNPFQTVSFFLAIFFMCLFRNQGIYVYLFFAVLLLCAWSLVCKKNREKTGWGSRFILFSFSVTAAWYLFSGPIPAAAGVEKGDAREMLCVPMQQLARVYTEEPEYLTDSEKKYIETLIEPDALKNYVRVNADPVKSGFHTEVLSEDPAEFFRVWAKIGLRRPETYADSFFMGNWGYWYPCDSQYWISYILFDGAFLEEPYNILGITRNSRLPVLESWLREISLVPAFQQIPILSILLNQAFPFWLMLVTAAGVWYRKEHRGLLPLTLILGYWGTLLLGPVTSLRYALPIIYCVPLMAELFLLGRTCERQSADI